MTKPITARPSLMDVIEMKAQHLGTWPNSNWVINNVPHTLLGGVEPIMNDPYGLTFFRAPKPPATPRLELDRNGFFKEMKTFGEFTAKSKYVPIPGIICMGDDVSSKQYPVILMHSHESGVFPTKAHFFVDQIYNGEPL
jgi:hypothetical protein